jgi:hypothetical protein
MLQTIKRRTTNPPPTPEERRRNIANIKWKLFDVFGYEPHAPQCEFHESTARNRFICAGTRGGKSRAAGEELAAYLMAGATQIWIVGNSYADTAKEFDYVYERMISQELQDMLGFSPLENCIYNESQGNMYMRTKWGSWIKCISLERTGGAFGEEVDVICMSEASQIKKPKNLYQRMLLGRLGSRLGDLIIPTTPGGKSNEKDPDSWLYEIYLKGFNKNESDYFTKEWPSWANPFWPEDPYELRRILDPLIFAEQYEGKFVTFAGSIYTKFNSIVHIIPPFSIPLHWRRYEAIDPGFRGEFAWLGATISEQGNLYITGEYDDQETSYEERVLNIKDTRCREYGITYGWYDKSRGIHEWDVFQKKQRMQVTTFIDPEDPQCAFEFSRLGLHCDSKITNNNVNVGIDRVQRRLGYTNRYRPRLYITQDCVKLIEAIEHHGWGEKTGQIRKPANDIFKHKADCLRYICAGNLMASEPAEPVEEIGDMYGILLEMQEKGNKVHPHTLTAMSRRGGYN